MTRYLILFGALFGCTSEPSTTDSAEETEKEGPEGVPSAEPTAEPTAEPAIEPDPIRMVGIWNAQTIQGQAFPYTETSADGSLTFNSISITLPDNYMGTTYFDTTIADSSGLFTFPYSIEGTATGTDISDGNVSILLVLDDDGMGILEPFTITCAVTESIANCTSEPDSEGNVLTLSFIKSGDAPEPSSEPSSESDTGI